MAVGAARSEDLGPLILVRVPRGILLSIAIDGWHHRRRSSSTPLDTSVARCGCVIARVLSVRSVHAQRTLSVCSEWVKCTERSSAVEVKRVTKKKLKSHSKRDPKMHCRAPNRQKNTRNRVVLTKNEVEKGFLGKCGTTFAFISGGKSL